MDNLSHLSSICSGTTVHPKWLAGPPQNTLCVRIWCLFTHWGIPKVQWLIDFQLLCIQRYVRTQRTESEFCCSNNLQIPWFNVTKFGHKHLIVWPVVSSKHITTHTACTLTENCSFINCTAAFSTRSTALSMCVCCRVRITFTEDTAIPQIGCWQRHWRSHHVASEGGLPCGGSGAVHSFRVSERRGSHSPRSSVSLHLQRTGIQWVHGLSLCK